MGIKILNVGDYVIYTGETEWDLALGEKYKVAHIESDGVWVVDDDGDENNIGTYYKIIEDVDTASEFTRENFLEFINSYPEGAYFKGASIKELITGYFEQFESFLESRKPVDKAVQDAIELLKGKGYIVDKVNNI